MAELSPMMQQYLEIKNQHKDEILFYRIGDFYEMFFDDAVTASRELDLTLTGKQCGLAERAPMCGVPFHSYEGYVARLIAKGYKVAICEQVEDPAKAKGLVKRDIILDQARKANDKDEELQNLIGEFNLARMDLNNEIGKSERDDARITELNEKVNNLYGQIMGNEGMVAYNEAKRECENLVNYIDAIINTAMNGGDPMTVQEPSASCTGSCSTCGGCH